MMTPQEAISRSPSARLSTQESTTVAIAIDEIERDLVAKWEGLTCQFTTAELTGAGIGALIRRLEEACWIVQATALDGKFGKAAELLARGQGVQWRMLISARWFVEGRPALALNVHVTPSPVTLDEHQPEAPRVSDADGREVPSTLV